MRDLSRSLVRGALALTVGALAACADASTGPRAFSVLDDVGQSDWTAVSVGTDHSCGIKTGGALYCWGSDRYGQLGAAVADTVCGSAESQIPCAVVPVRSQPSFRFLSVSAGARHTCGITTTREAYCWGANDLGQVGASSAGGPVAVRVPGTLGWAQISAGYTHSCAVRTDGGLYCWGANDRGQLGNGNFATGVNVTRVSMAAPVALVSAGQQRTCARTISGNVFCWGAVWMSRSGGLEVTRAQVSPQAVPGAPAMASLSVGSFTTCGTDAAGSAFCWEGNPRGEMGTGTLDGSTTPLPVAGGLTFVQLSAGIVQSCGITASGAGYCWGDDSFGQLGVSSALLVERCADQRLPCSTRPVPIFGRQRFVDISTGFGSHACGVTVQGNLYCWGLGISGQRGDGTAVNASATPVKVREPQVAAAKS
jgi:alpha-tubulin suppressor-like RCC1 family protein